MAIQVLDGNKLTIPTASALKEVKYTKVKLPIEENGIQVELGLSEDDFSKHILIIGGIGSGKTNTFKHIP